MDYWQRVYGMSAEALCAKHGHNWVFDLDLRARMDGPIQERCTRCGEYRVAKFGEHLVKKEKPEDKEKP